MENNIDFNVYSSTQYFNSLSHEFSQYHQKPLNVMLHLFTTPLGFVGLLSILRAYTNSSSLSICLVAVYLLTLLPMLPSGEFIGTVVLCIAIAIASGKLELGFLSSIAIVIVGYVLQDLAHLGTGETTFQSTYSDGGQIDINNPMEWMFHFFNHAYYLIPLCVHVALPYVLPTFILQHLSSPIPTPLQQLHVFGGFLMPLVCCAFGSYCLDSKNGFCFFPGAPYFYRICQCNLLNTGYIEGETGERHESRKEDLVKIRSWAMEQNPAEDTSSHWWYSSLPEAPKKAFDNVTASTQIINMFRTLFSEKNYCLEVIEEMNEIYVSSPQREAESANSDHVFFARHVDGPFGFIPFVSVYRCIVGLDKNFKYVTNFPIANLAVNACEGDVLAFDYHREVHHIYLDESKKEISDKFRVTLKLHYCIYPRILAPLGWFMRYISAKYNKSFRALFLKTINPTTLYEHFLAWNVNFNTFIFDRLETILGWRNITYIVVVLALWRVTGVYSVFMGLTSFIHYFRYISTFYIREGIDFGSFKRDVILFKNIALAQLFYLYLFPSSHPFEFDPFSIFLIVTGYSISAMAFMALGVDRTYFGSELGLAESKWITQFPYGYIPHPMIVCQIVGLLGFYKAAHFRAEWPYVVPVHILLYVIHMLQEHFDIYRKPTTKPKTA